ncbi:CsgG/HfaB family protein [Cyanobacterium aponinum UTEX 3221]|uniref:CsgG/HfaB family protein n=1 Tax=Cyanobacterium aponinum TaxID=379064 RepID=UPI002B4BE000|nr:CsgG/HfaB family protein [Cyanobacterium aponinum]WRL40013.1 CsgG/HfaB family protein [Cyanobacterium aponinum UTEX 3221]
MKKHFYPKNFSFLLIGILAAFAIETNINFVKANPSPSIVAQTTNDEKIRVAVLDFDYSAVSNPTWLSYFNGGAKGVSDMIVNQLVETGKYRVIERSRLDAILAEQNLGASGRVDASTAAEIGRLLGVEMVVIGSVTQFDIEKRGSNFGLFGVSVGNESSEAYVTLNSRIVNTNTGEILMTAEGKGVANQSDDNVRVFTIGGGTSTSNETKLLTVATQEAVKGIVSKMSENEAKLAAVPKVLPNIDAVVADVSGGTVVLNKGSQDGYRTGMKVSIERVGKEIKDPETGKVIRRLTTAIGVVELYDVDTSSSLGKIISGNGFKVGDVATPKE